MSANGVPDLLRLKDIDTYYGEIHILENLSLNIREGELVSLLGGNASGKSTTLKTTGSGRGWRSSLRTVGSSGR